MKLDVAGWRIIWCCSLSDRLPPAGRPAAQYGRREVWVEPRVWGVFVRTVLTWHITWSVNSVTHVWGYQNYDTGDNSRNNILVGLWSNGEGWHNNHHADQRAAAHGHKWWEFDVTWITIRMLEKLGLVKNVVLPRAWTKSEAQDAPT
jgi:fatty-acid desaturase